MQEIEEEECDVAFPSRKTVNNVSKSEISCSLSYMESKEGRQAIEILKACTTL